MRNFLLNLVVLVLVAAGAAFVPANMAEKLFDCFLAVCVFGGGAAFVVCQFAEGVLALGSRRTG
jgi:hypothetical protein